MYKALYGDRGREKRKGRYNVDAGDEMGETTGEGGVPSLGSRFSVFFSLFCFTCGHDVLFACLSSFVFCSHRALTARLYGDMM
jgi:hypothetical protein